MCGWIHQHSLSKQHWCVCVRYVSLSFRTLSPLYCYMHCYMLRGSWLLSRPWIVKRENNFSLLVFSFFCLITLRKKSLQSHFGITDIILLLWYINTRYYLISVFELMIIDIHLNVIKTCHLDSITFTILTYTQRKIQIIDCPGKGIGRINT